MCLPIVKGFDGVKDSDELYSRRFSGSKKMGLPPASAM